LVGDSLRDILAETAVSAFVGIKKSIINFLIEIMKPNCYFFEGIKI